MATPSLVSSEERPLDIRKDGDGVPFAVRPYQPRFRAALQQFYEAFEPKRAAQGLPPAGVAQISRWLGSTLGHGLHLLAFREEELIAHALVMPTERPGIGEYAVFLRQDLRGRGVGTELNRVVVDTARAAGLRGLWLTVEPRNRAAIRSYEKAGFHFVPETIFSVEAEMELSL
ncbi:MAG: GNAT family N-acetyltransferase [Gemmatimonadota bacterium]